MSLLADQPLYARRGCGFRHLRSGERCDAGFGLDFGLRYGRRIFGHRVRPDRIILQRISGLEEIRPNDILTARIDGVVDAAYGVFGPVIGELPAFEQH